MPPDRPRSHLAERTLVDKRLTHLQELGVIHRQDLNGNSPDRREADKKRSIQTEMLGPSVLAWMVQADDFTSNGIAASDVGPLVTITVETRECQIVDAVLALMLARNDVIDLGR